MLFVLRTFLKMKQTTYSEGWLQIFESIFIYTWWTCNGLYEWMMHIIDVIRTCGVVNYYWYLCGGREHVTVNVGLLTSKDIFYGPSKTIRTKKTESEFSWKHKQKILNDVYHQKRIGHVVFMRTIGEYGERFHMVIDGNSRMITLYEFFNNQITWNGKRFSQLSVEDRKIFSNYKIEIEFL